MVLIALASAKGAPGVTTSAMALTLQWPRDAVLIEADLAGSSILPGFFRGQLAHDRGLNPLAIAHSHGNLEVELRNQTLQLVADDETKRILPGPVGPHTVPALREIWAPLASYLVSLEAQSVDVIVDLGRIPAGADPREALMKAADLVLITTSSTLPAIAAARALVDQRLDTVDPTALQLTNYALLTIGPGRPYAAAEIAKSLNLASTASLAWDPVTAEVLSVGTKPGRRYPDSPLMKSVTSSIESIQSRIAQRRALLTTPTKES